jgi:GYF domain 2
MYTIIGGDGKQYGPISESDIRKWIAEGRLNAQSLAKAESDAEFRTLAAFPELADMFGLPAPTSGIAPPLGVDNGAQEEAARKVKVPAIGLIIAASISLLEAVWSLLTINSTAEKIQQVEQQLQDNPQAAQMVSQMAHLFSGPFGIANFIFQIIIAILILIGAIKMLKLKSYEFSYAAAILSVLPCINPCCGWILGLIFGIWAMVILGKLKPHFS